MANQNNAQQSLLKRAADLYRKGDRAGAAKALGKALDANPVLAQNQAAQKLAARITGLSPEKAALLLSDPTKRDAFVLKVGRSGPQPRANRVNLVMWGFGLVFVAVIAFIVINLIATGNFRRMNPEVLNVAAGQTERRAIGADPTREYYVVLPTGPVPEYGWPTLVAVHGAGQTGTDMATLLGEATRANGILLLAPTFPDLSDSSGEVVLQDARNTILLMLEDAQIIGLQRPVAGVHLLGQVYFGYGAGARLASWVASEGLNYPDAGYTIDLPLGIALANSSGNLFPAPDRNINIPYVITAGENPPQASLSRTYADNLASRGFSVTFELVPGADAALVQRQIDLTIELVKRVYNG